MAAVHIVNSHPLPGLSYHWYEVTIRFSISLYGRWNWSKPPDETLEQGRNRSWQLFILEQNSLTTEFSAAILIGSRTPSHSLSNFRGVLEHENADWDIICSSQFPLNWVHGSMINWIYLYIYIYIYIKICLFVLRGYLDFVAPAPVDTPIEPSVPSLLLVHSTLGLLISISLVACNFHLFHIFYNFIKTPKHFNSFYW